MKYHSHPKPQHATDELGTSSEQNGQSVDRHYDEFHSADVKQVGLSSMNNCQESTTYKQISKQANRTYIARKSLRKGDDLAHSRNDTRRR